MKAMMIIDVDDIIENYVADVYHRDAGGILKICKSNVKFVPMIEGFNACMDELVRWSDEANDDRE